MLAELTQALDRVEMVQKYAARVVIGTTVCYSITLLMSDTGWSTLSYRTSNHRVALFYSIINDLSPPYLEDLMPDSDGDSIRYALHSPNDLIMEMCRTPTFAKSFLPNMVNEWNEPLLLSCSQYAQQRKNSMVVRLNNNYHTGYPLCH